MAPYVVNATKDSLLHFEVCPSYTTKCGCPTDPAGKPAPPHPMFEFAAAPSDPKDTRSADQWAQACALEACRIVAYIL